jgi:hypothetical protein
MVAIILTLVRNMIIASCMFSETVCPYIAVLSNEKDLKIYDIC